MEEREAAPEGPPEIGPPRGAITYRAEGDWLVYSCGGTDLLRRPLPRPGGYEALVTAPGTSCVAGGSYLLSPPHDESALDTCRDLARALGLL